MPHAYPILLDLTHRRVVIVGGGTVAARKAAGLVEAGADDVTAVALRFDDDFPPAVRRIEAPYSPGSLDGASLVFAATDSAAVNAQVVGDARARNVFVCRADADDDTPGDFVTPAKAGDGNLLVAVSAGSAALSARMRDAIAAGLDPRWAQMSAAMTALRPWVRGQNLPQPRRAAIFRALASDRALDVLAKGGAAALREWVMAAHPELKANPETPSDACDAGRDRPQQSIVQAGHD
jgi:siroheme synthase-like protein